MDTLETAAPDTSTQAPPPQPVAATQPAPTQAGQILMVAPTGETAYVAPDKVAANEANGAEVGIRMVGPDGSKAVIPFSKQDANQKQGAKWDAHPDNDAAKAFLTQRQPPSDFEADQEEAKRLVESGAGPAAAYMKPARTAKAVEGMVAVGSGAGALAGIMGLAAPGIITEEVATGLLDEFGEPITRQIVKEGPSILGKGFQLATKWVQAHPTTAKAVIEAAGVGVGLKILGKMARLAQEFGGK